MFLVRDEEAYSDEQSSSQRYIFTASHDSHSSVSMNMWKSISKIFSVDHYYTYDTITGFEDREGKKGAFIIKKAHSH